MNSKKSYTFDPQQHRGPLLGIFRELLAHLDDADGGGPVAQPVLQRILRRFPRDGRGFYSRGELIAGYRALAGEAGLDLSAEEFAVRLRMRPVRTHSGVMPVTVLSKPFPCPGQCVFCPNDVRMPKSYLSDEPGCQRAEQNGFDPYLQTYNRMAALAAIGHPTDKIELIVLGGTWSFYPKPYQRWFVKRCLDALSDFGKGVDGRTFAETQRFEMVSARGESLLTTRGASGYNRVVEHHLRTLGQGQALRSFEEASWAELSRAHEVNSEAGCRCVGLVVETRPDYVTPEEVVHLRRLGCTKVQLGYQSLSDPVLLANKRGHDVAAIRRATGLLRHGGFKVLAHFMPNLLGATPESDLEGFRQVFEDPGFCPDEMKVYPCSLVETAELMDFYQSGAWRPYTQEELLEVLCGVIAATPRYCRLSRVIRDICSQDIVVGNRFSNFREVAERELDRRGIGRKDIRSREVGATAIELERLRLRVCQYEAAGGKELFLEYVTPEDRIAGFCRVRIPASAAEQQGDIPVELQGAAVIRELHVYGNAQSLGQQRKGQAQHQGLGRALLNQAAQVAREAGYGRLAVISAVGTRGYYRRQGFEDGELYQHRDLSAV